MGQLASVSAGATNETNEPERATDVLSRLRRIVGPHGMADLGAHLADLADLVRWDVTEVERSLESIPRFNELGGEFHVQRSAHHLLDLGGKRLRPICVALGARTGTGFSPAARELAVAVELVHCATLLHDDVVDVGDQRRGAPSARTVYGNAASIFAGDWLLVTALQRVRRADVGAEVLGRLLDVIEEMIFAESIQLEQRGRVDTSLEDYFKVVEGKTAALFRWAMFAGARAGGAGDEEASLLERYGMHLGVAFQLVDDLLDYAGDPDATGKALFTDLREGKMTYPLLVARDGDATARALLQQVVENEADDARAMGALLEKLRTSGALEACRDLALEHADQAIATVADLPEGRAREALVTVAHATVQRGR